MAVESHIASLQQRHQQLEALLDEMQSAPTSGDVDISDIKRQKLQIKDRIEFLKTSSGVN